MFGYGFWISYYLISCFVLFELLVTCNLGVKVGGLSSLSQQKVKDIPSKKKLVDCCYQDMVSPMCDYIYDEGLQEDDF